MTVYRLTTVLLTCLAFAWAGCGDDDKPGPSAPPPVDATFVNRITAHTETSRRLAELAVDEARQGDVKKLARQMARARAAELQKLRGLQERLGGVPGGKDPLGVSADAAAEGIRPEILQSAKPFDRTFLQVMSQHHQGALALIGAESQKGKDPALKALAQELGVARADELARLQELQS